MNRLLIVLACLVVLIFGWSAYLGQSPHPAGASTSLTPKTGASKIYFVPIADFPRERLEPLIQYYRQEYDLEIIVTDGIPVDPRDEG
jgi:hypothetical protein